MAFNAIGMQPDLHKPGIPPIPWSRQRRTAMIFHIMTSPV
jgi:hypothetical protein